MFRLAMQRSTKGVGDAVASETVVQRAHFGTLLALVLLAMGTATGCRSGLSAGRSRGYAGRELVGRSGNLALPYAIAVVGRFLAVGDNADTMLALFDRMSGERVAAAGRRGAGPGELEGVWTLQGLVADSGTNRIWVFDADQNRVVEYGVSNSGALKFTGRQVESQLPGKTLSFYWVSDTIIVAVGYFSQGRFFIADSTGRPTVALGAIPYASATFPALAAQQALQPTAAVRPGGRAVAIAARYAGRIDIYDTRTGELHTADVPIPFEPDLKLLRNDKIPVLFQGPDTRFGYVSIAATSSRIYALFSGRTRTAFPHRANFGSQVHVFDWNGKFLNSIELGLDALQIAIDPAGTTMYVVSHDPEPSVVVYDLR